MKSILLSRDKFREGVFERDDHKCVVCGNPAKDAHHIIERRLFQDGGYYLNNGASLCETHHVEAEETIISCEQIREMAGIKEVILPEHLYRDTTYDKWGNIVLPSGDRLKGELFYDGSVQKILAQGKVLDLFKKYIKYPRTYHLPWSNLLKDDRMLKDDSAFYGKSVVVTLKMDGENTTMYNDYIHARSVDGNTHESRNWVKGLWSKIGYQIDENMRLCGENLYAVHSIRYQELKSFFMLFSIWIDNRCLSWSETVEFAAILGLETVPVIYQGIYDKDKITEAFKPFKKAHEGYVVRVSDEFSYNAFRMSVAKYVSPEFRVTLNQSHGAWISKKIEKNHLCE